ncbi:MAG TPA: hypothetical protein VJL87_05055 [Bdellovibrionota bacterium]|nr:hypothetical protein [Bdellovibrionota bacterium]
MKTLIFSFLAIVLPNLCFAGGFQETNLGDVKAVKRVFQIDIEACNKAMVMDDMFASCEVAVVEKKLGDLEASYSHKEVEITYNNSSATVEFFGNEDGFGVYISKAKITKEEALAYIVAAQEKFGIKEVYSIVYSIK